MMNFKYTIKNDIDGLNIEFALQWADYEEEENIIEELCTRIAEAADACYCNAYARADYDAVDMCIPPDQATFDEVMSLIEFEIKEYGLQYNKTRKYADTYIYEVVA
ncbi:MAG: hypothetical protein E7167_01505 [Firmicutes bacterium]|nr:hypothetical protein [Bacillota bacterium]